MWVAAIVVIGKLILVRKDKCFGTTYQHKRPSQKLKNSERLRAILRAILRASQCNLLIFNKYFARKNMKITSN